jgi:hypothetical protein
MAMTMVQSTTGSQMRRTDVSFLKQIAPNDEIRGAKNGAAPYPAPSRRSRQRCIMG